MTLPEKIEAATSKLAVALQFAIDPLVLGEWVQSLDDYTPDELTAAFERARKQITAFPSPAHLVEYIEKTRFRDALALVLSGLPVFGSAWQDKPEMAHVVWDYHSDEAKAKGDRIERRVIIAQPQAAPPIPERMKRTLEIYGQFGQFKAGLSRLARTHPMLDARDEDRRNAHISTLQLERELWQAWMEAA